MSSIFTKIINREIPAEIVWEDDRHLAFMDIKPVKPGHLLVIPKKEIDYLFDMDDDAYTALFLAAKQLAAPLMTATGARRIGVAVEGFGVDHVHVHLIPIDAIGELDPNKAKEADPAELTAMAQKIRSLL